MQCNTCGTSLLPGASTCPRCGALTTISSDYDAVPYIDSQEYVKQAVPSTSPAISGRIATSPFAPAGNSTAVNPEQKTLQRQKIPAWMTVLILVLALLLMLGGIGSVVYAVNFRPAELHAQATTVARTFLTEQAQGTAQANTAATATAQAMTPEQIYQQATSGTPVIDDPLKDESGNVWSSVTYPGRFQCAFRDGAYHILSTGNRGGLCIGTTTFFHDLAFQVQITMLHAQVAGLVFRLQAEATQLNYYSVSIGNQGNYYIQTNKDQASGGILKTGISRAILTGPKQSNTITAIARGSFLGLYVNGQPVSSLIDTSYSSGQIAFGAASAADPVDAAFTHVKVWKV